MRRKGHITYSVEFNSLTRFFLVAKIWKKKINDKVADEIWMVYNTKKSGLNKAVHDP